VPASRDIINAAQVLLSVSESNRYFIFKFLVFIRVDLILSAFITENSSLEPLHEGLLAQIHIDLS